MSVGIAEAVKVSVDRSIHIWYSFIHSFIHSFIDMVPEEEKEQRKGDSQRPNPSIRHSVARPSTASLARLRVENGDAPELDNCVYAWARACVRADLTTWCTGEHTMSSRAGAYSFASHCLPGKRERRATI